MGSQARTWMQEINQRPQRSIAYWDSPSSSRYLPHTLCPLRGGTSCARSSTINQHSRKCYRDLPTGQSGQVFPQLRFSPPRCRYLWFVSKLMKSNQHTVLYLVLPYSLLFCLTSQSWVTSELSSLISNFLFNVYL